MTFLLPTDLTRGACRSSFYVVTAIGTDLVENTQMRPRPQFREAGPIKLVFESTASSLFILKALSAISKIARPIDNDAVAAGEGTFHTCSMCSLCTN